MVYFYSVLFHCLLGPPQGSLLVDLMKFDFYPRLIASGESPGSKYTDPDTHTHKVTHAPLLLSLPCLTVQRMKAALLSFMSFVYVKIP